MHKAISRLRSVLLTGAGHDPGSGAVGTACSWDVMRALYQAQAARGVPEAIAGLEHIQRGRWPTSGTPRRA